MSDGSLTPTKKGRNDFEELESMTKEELIARIREQDVYVKQLESKRPRFDRGDEEVDSSLQERLKQQQRESARRENTLVHRLTTKEQELQEYMNQLQEMKQSQTQASSQLRSMLLDPAVNIVFQRMGRELDECQEKLKQTQNELSAWKFTPDSQTGKQLMTRCRNLLQENEDLGKQIASGRTAKLEGDIALQKTLVTEMKENQADLDEFLGELEEDTEGMQSVIYVLQQQLRDTKEQLNQLQEENTKLRAQVTMDDERKPDIKEEDFQKLASTGITNSPQEEKTDLLKQEAYGSDIESEDESWSAVKTDVLGNTDYKEEQYLQHSDAERENHFRSNCEDNFSPHSSPDQRKHSPSHNTIKEEVLETAENSMEVDLEMESVKKSESLEDNFEPVNLTHESQGRDTNSEEAEIEQESHCNTETGSYREEVDGEPEAMETDHVQPCSSPFKEQSPSRTSGEVNGDDLPSGEPSNSGDLGDAGEPNTQQKEAAGRGVAERTSSEGEIRQEDSSSSLRGRTSPVPNTNGNCADAFHSKVSPDPPIVCHAPVSKEIASMIDKADEKAEMLNGVTRPSAVDDIEDS